MKTQEINIENDFWNPFNPKYSHKVNRIRNQEIFRQAYSQRFETLTKRELEVVGLLANGLSSPQISEKLFVSRHTVEQHRKNINRKLDVHSLVDLLKYALAFDLI